MSYCRRIIPCLDVKNGRVIKGVAFKNHEDVGDIVELAWRYRDQGADELVFYDITASADGRSLDPNWVRKVAKVLDIPFCVAGGIRTARQAAECLDNGADKISINSPALERPDLVDELAKIHGSQSIVVGIDSLAVETSSQPTARRYEVKQYTGRPEAMKTSGRATIEWAREVQSRGAGEIVLNCMNEDGKRRGYDLQQLKLLQNAVQIPVVASGGAGQMQDFADLFDETNISAALAASVFHKNLITIPELKEFLLQCQIQVRPPTRTNSLHG